MKLLENLQYLESKSTPGPWSFAIESGDYFIMTADYTNYVGSDEDIVFISEMRNALPKLLAVVQAAKTYMEDDDSRFDLYCALVALEEGI